MLLSRTSFFSSCSLHAIFPFLFLFLFQPHLYYCSAAAIVYQQGRQELMDPLHTSVTARAAHDHVED